MNYNKKIKVSVVIPTLGGKCLIKTINSLLKSSISPFEILICIPEENKVTKLLKSQPIIKIIETKKRGQVFQRSVGFLKAKCDYVLQLDDDEILDVDCIKNLLETFYNQNTSLISVAPLILDYNTKLSVYPIPKYNFLNFLLYFVLNGSKGYASGALTLAGTGIGVNPKLFSSQKTVNVEWLPGGCILHKNKNLIFDDYFPFKGKAFNEDLIHSFLLRQNGNKLYINLKAKAYIINENPMLNISLKNYLKNLSKDFSSRNFLLSLIGKKNKIRMYIYYILIMVKFIFLKCTKSGNSYHEI